MWISKLKRWRSSRNINSYLWKNCGKAVDKLQVGSSLELSTGLSTVFLLVINGVIHGF